MDVTVLHYTLLIIDYNPAKIQQVTLRYDKYASQARTVIFAHCAGILVSARTGQRFRQP
jgi:hypothetical protein